MVASFPTVVTPEEAMTTLSFALICPSTVMGADMRSLLDFLAKSFKDRLSKDASDRYKSCP